MLLQILLLLTAIPLGFLLAYLTKDELLAGKPWFKAIIIIAVIITGWFFLTKQTTIALTAAFITITAFFSYLKSYDKKWANQPKL